MRSATRANTVPSTSRVQVAGIHADDACSGVDRAVDLLLVVHPLDERRRRPRLRPARPGSPGGLAERGDDEQDHVRPVRLQVLS